MLPQVTATRYVTPLREGGSLPGVLEADNLGTYVVKFRGAGQGPKALIAEVIGAGLARRLGLRTPELAVVQVDPVIGRSEPDEEVQDLLKASGGANLGVDFLSGALGFHPVVHDVDPVLAAQIIWFDAFIENVDRSWRNPNLLMWHGQLWLIDHGASLYFHHNWASAPGHVLRPFQADDHVLREQAGPLSEVDFQITGELLAEVVADIPPDWLGEVPVQSYVEHLAARAAQPEAWLPQ